MYFLIEHNRETKDTFLKEYTSLIQARQERLKRELLYLRKRQDEIEVVVFEADSKETLKKTHSRYFVKDNQSEKIFQVALVALATGVIYKLFKK